MLLSITGFNLDLHLCQDEVKSFSVFSGAESCSGYCEEPQHPVTPDGINRKPCCTNEHYFFSPEFEHTEGILFMGPISLDHNGAFVLSAILSPDMLAQTQVFNRPPPDIPLTSQQTEALFQEWLI